ncbi:hypothetical protein [Micromonospora sp. WMMC273]|uniref:hypothetical protein n=1 Tax=Micromonospora sp. WMMC273 TaxID=3015157 RepID=UPI0022B60779|nr:hypothetical protein [Micromonospora sp. WMMC273]MCZ7478931.1 hypothetical protein [Micromonospora sp. WMMC273]MCZ7478992.1 hypothetical protein [Micromonospora sp. WMMC273]
MSDQPAAPPLGPDPDPGNAGPEDWAGVDYDDPALEEATAAAEDPDTADPLPGDYRDDTTPTDGEVAA